MQKNIRHIILIIMIIVISSSLLACGNAKVKETKIKSLLVGTNGLTGLLLETEKGEEFSIGFGTVASSFLNIAIEELGDKEIFITKDGSITSEEVDKFSIIFESFEKENIITLFNISSFEITHPEHPDEIPLTTTAAGTLMPIAGTIFSVNDYEFIVGETITLYKSDDGWQLTEPENN